MVRLIMGNLRQLVYAAPAVTRRGHDHHSLVFNNTALVDKVQLAHMPLVGAVLYEYTRHDYARHPWRLISLVRSWLSKALSRPMLWLATEAAIIALSQSVLVSGMAIETSTSDVTQRSIHGSGRQLGELRDTRRSSSNMPVRNISRHMAVDGL